MCGILGYELPVITVSKNHKVQNQTLFQFKRAIKIKICVAMAKPQLHKTLEQEFNQ